MCGGAGTRVWPASRETMPKQFIPLLGELSTFQETLRRLDFEYGGDRDLDFHVDGQIAHGVERAVPALVRHMGYDILWR